MSGLAICGVEGREPVLEEIVKVFSLPTCVLGRCSEGRGVHKQLHLLLLRRVLPQLMISNDIIRQSAHKQMLEALPKQCQLSRFASPRTYYLYRAFKFVMLITPLLACRMWHGEKTGTMTLVGVSRNSTE